MADEEWGELGALRQRLAALAITCVYDQTRYLVRDELVEIARAFDAALIEAQAEVRLLRAIVAESRPSAFRGIVAEPLGRLWDRLPPRSRRSAVVGAVYDRLRP